MKDDHEDDDRTLRTRSKLSLRSQAEAAWLRDSVLGNGGHAPPASASLRAARQQRIREAAYFKAKRRGFAPGHELDDWLAAEAEIGG